MLNLQSHVIAGSAGQNFLTMAVFIVAAWFTTWTAPGTSARARLTRWAALPVRYRRGHIRPGNVWLFVAGVVPVNATHWVWLHAAGWALLVILAYLPERLEQRAYDTATLWAPRIDPPPTEAPSAAMPSGGRVRKWARRMRQALVSRDEEGGDPTAAGATRSDYVLAA